MAINKRVYGLRKIENTYSDLIQSIFLDKELSIITPTRYSRLKRIWQGIRPIPKTITKTSLEDLIDQIEDDLIDDSLDIEEDEFLDEIDDELEMIDVGEKELSTLFKSMLGLGSIYALRNVISNFNKANDTDIELPKISENEKDIENQLDTFDTDVNEFINNYSLELADTISNTQKNLIKGFLFKNITEQTDYDKLERSITLLKGMNKSRARGIARTELTRINSYTTKRFADLNGITQWEWNVNEPRDFACIQNAGEVVPIGEPFSSGDITPPIHPNRIDSETYVFTKSGWKQSIELNRKDIFLSLTPQYQLEWVKATIISECDYPIWHYYKSKTMDIMVSDDHQLCYISDWDAKYNNCKWQLKKSNEIKANNFFIPKTSRQLNTTIEDEYTLSLAKLYGVYIGDGSISSKNYIKIAQKENNNPNYNLVKDVCKKYWDIKCSDNWIYVDVGEIITRELKSLGICYYKYIPDWIKNGSHELIRSFLDGLLITDGYIKKGKSWGEYQCREEKMYFTTSSRLMEDITYCLLKIGKGISYRITNWERKGGVVCGRQIQATRPCFIINELDSNNLFVDKNKHLKVYNEKRNGVGITLEKNHTLFIKRNNKTCWVGNCECYLEPYYNINESEVDEEDFEL